MCAILRLPSPVLARPTYSSISLGGLPAAATRLGSRISSGITASIAQDGSHYARRSFIPFCRDCAARRPAVSRPSREGLEGRFLGLMAYLDGKPEGDDSMPEK